MKHCSNLLFPFFAFFLVLLFLIGCGEKPFEPTGSGILTGTWNGRLSSISDNYTISWDASLLISHSGTSASGKYVDKAVGEKEYDFTGNFDESTRQLDVNWSSSDGTSQQFVFVL